MTITYKDLNEGQRRLGSQLVSLPRHPLDKDTPNYLCEMLGRFDNVPETILIDVAEEIEERAYDPIEPPRRRQPRYDELRAMVEAAVDMWFTFNVLLLERKEAK